MDGDDVMKYVIKAVLMSMIICFTFTTYCLADDTSLGRTPEGVYPIKNNDIVMVDELVNVYIKEGKVECTFTFKNTGEETKVLMGFPATLDEIYIQEALGDYEDGSITNFTAFDGEEQLLVVLENEVEVELDDSNKRKWYDKWYTFDVNFGAGETKIIKNTYQFKTPITAGGPGLASTGYVLDTGAAWKGNIGHAKVVFHFKDMPFTRIESFHPFDISALTLEDDKLIFEKSDFEPDFNLEFNYWMDPGKLDENEAFSAYLNYDRYMRINRFFELTEPYDIDRSFKESVLKGDSIATLYLLNKINKAVYLHAAPEIGEFTINNDKSIDLSVLDLSGDLKSVRYEISSIEEPGRVIFQEEKILKENSINGFRIKHKVYPRNYESKSFFKLKVSARDYKDNTLKYETDIYFNGDSTVVKKDLKEAEKSQGDNDALYEEVENKDTDISTNGDNELKESDLEEKEENRKNKYIEYITYLSIGLLLLICIIQQTRISKLKRKREIQ